jgi:hypothetical protein
MFWRWSMFMLGVQGSHAFNAAHGGATLRFPRGDETKLPVASSFALF